MGFTYCARPSFAALATILALYVILISFGPVALISETAGAMLLVTAVADFKKFAHVAVPALFLTN